jgi:hypothetical protein
MLLKSYCARQNIARDKVQPWKSVLAPEGHVFRYKLPAVEGKEKRGLLDERYAFVFIDPGAGNVYDVKMVRSSESWTTLHGRTFAILRLMDTKVTTKEQALAVMGDLYRLQWWLLSSKEPARDHEPARLIQILKDERGGINRVTIYRADSPDGIFDLSMEVDDDGYVVQFAVTNRR